MLAKLHAEILALWIGTQIIEKFCLFVVIYLEDDGLV